MKVPPILIVADELANVVLCGRKPQTVSKRAAEARAKGKRWGCLVCGWLGRVFPANAEGVDHCGQALNDAGQGA